MSYIMSLYVLCRGTSLLIFVKVVLCVKNRSDMGQAENDKEIVAINQMRVKVSWINILTVE